MRWIYMEMKKEMFCKKNNDNEVKNLINKNNIFLVIF